MRKLSFVIPCYGSEKTLKGVVSEIIETIKQNKDFDYEIILVNDNSPDNVWNEIRELCKKNSKIRGVNLAKNFGQHSALMAGYKYCSGEIIISLDDDGQTPANELFSLVDKIDEGYDVVFASYPIKKHSIGRNLGSYINRVMTEKLIDKPRDLIANSYYAARDFVIMEMIRYENSYPYIGGLVFRTTKNITNVLVRHRSREFGNSGYNLKKLLSLWMNGFTAFSVKPLRIATILGFICSACGFSYGSWTIIEKLFIDSASPMGYSSTMAAIMFIGGMIMLMLGLIGEYIGRIYISINNAPQYVIREKLNCNMSKEGNNTYEQD